MSPRDYRATHGLPLTEGYVILGPDGEPCGWTLGLDRPRGFLQAGAALAHPRHFRPGAVAVDPAGRRWRAKGGNDDEGGTLWVPEDSIVPFDP
jgi:hypothetical protein